ncbi:MAG: CHASE2 domain-containing protein [Cyanobacteria bacterium J06581_3]
MRKIVLNLGNGTLSNGCQTVIGEVFESLSGSSRTTATSSSRFTGQLPAAPQLAAMQQQWLQLYHARHQDQLLRIRLLQQQGICYSAPQFRALCNDIKIQLNQWLDSPEFRSIDQILRRELARTDSAQIILETTDTQLRKLPWHLWRMLEQYSYVELSFGTDNWHSLPPLSFTSAQSRILVTLGHGNGLNLAADCQALSDLSNTQLKILESPSLNQLHEQLWQPEGWDIFFFAGHSQTNERIGIIDLNDQEQLTIEQLKYALGKAIEQGLKIAIFNSCDGLGLAQQLSDLQIPYVVVMREPVPDSVAQQFVHYLLAAFADGAPFHLAVREARQRLAGLENDSPGASWLPIVWQNPTAPAIYWQDLQQAENIAIPSKHQRWRSPCFKSLLLGGGVLLLRALGALEPLELAAYDRLMRQRPTEPIDPRIVTVEISEQATSDYGYPLPDEVLTDLIEKVNQAEPLAIGLDIHRARPHPVSQETGHAKLLRQVEENPNLFLVCSYSSRDKNVQAPRELPEQLRQEQVGFSDLPVDVASRRMSAVRSEFVSPSGDVDSDRAVVRRQLLSYDPTFSPTSSTCTTPYSFSFQLAYQYLYEKGITPLTVTENERWQFGSVVFEPLPQRLGGYQNLERSSSQILLNYRVNRPAHSITLEDLFTDNFDPQMVRNRIVLIGYNAPISRDYFETPYGQMSGLWVHAHMVSQLVSTVLDNRPLIQGLPQWRNFQWGDILWILVWSCASGYAASAIKRTSLWLIVMITSAFLLYWVCWLLLIYGVWLPLMPTMLGATGSATAVRLSSRRYARKASGV